MNIADFLDGSPAALFVFVLVVTFIAGVILLGLSRLDRIIAKRMGKSAPKPPPRLSLLQRIVKMAAIAAISAGGSVLLLAWMEFDQKVSWTASGLFQTAAWTALLWLLAARWLRSRGPLSVITASVVIPCIAFWRSLLFGSAAIIESWFQIIVIHLSIGILTYTIVRWDIWRAWYRRRKGLCPDCGYDLRGANHVKCPECGREAFRERVA